MFFFLIDAALAVGGLLLLIQQYQTGFQGAKKVGAEAGPWPVQDDRYTYTRSAG